MAQRNAASQHADPMAAIAAARDVAAMHDSNDDSGDDSGSDESVDMVTFAVDAMNAMTLAERRRVYALKGLYAEYKELRTRLHDEVAELQRKQHDAARRLYELRRAIVCGERDVTADEVAAVKKSGGGDDNDDEETTAGGNDASAAAAADKSSGSGKTTKKKGGNVTVMSPHDAAHTQALAQAAASATGGIPGFWLHALRHSDVFSGNLSERDAAVLQFLRDIAVDYVDGNPSKGVVLSFTFAPNEHFSNTTLTKTYAMAYDPDDDDVAVTHVRGCDIAWTSRKHDVTVRVKQVKQRNKRTKQLRIVEREEKCESFFRFFAPPRDPDASTTSSSGDKDDTQQQQKKDKPHQQHDDDDEDDDVDYEQEMAMDIEAGQALMEEVVPKAAYYYAGKAVEDIAKQLRKQYGFAGNDDEDDDDDDDNGGDDKGMPAAKGGAAAPKAAGGAKAQQAKGEECKQQ